MQHALQEGGIYHLPSQAMHVKLFLCGMYAVYNDISDSATTLNTKCMIRSRSVSNGHVFINM